MLTYGWYSLLDESNLTYPELFPAVESNMKFNVVLLFNKLDLTKSKTSIETDLLFLGTTIVL
ncbi:hypothetical protein D3C73_1674320 [compost metagenome]